MTRSKTPVIRLFLSLASVVVSHSSHSTYMVLKVLLLATGTLCVHKGSDKGVECVNAVGTTFAALPSATTGIIPLATPISAESNLISYSPLNAWKTANAQSSCTTSSSVHITNVVNATVSFNYTGMLLSHSLPLNTAEPLSFH